jgi:hypothetical protein
VSLHTATGSGASSQKLRRKNEAKPRLASSKGPGTDSVGLSSDAASEIRAAMACVERCIDAHKQAGNVERQRGKGSYPVRDELNHVIAKLQKILVELEIEGL